MAGSLSPTIISKKATMKKFSPSVFGGALMLALLVSLVGCGGGGNEETSVATDSTVYGVAARGAAIDGTATLRDKDGATRTTTISRLDGTFEFDVAGLNPPYFLKATPSDGGSELYSVATNPGNFNINPLANLAVLAAAKDIAPATKSPDVPFNDPASFSSLTTDQVVNAVDRVMSRMSPEFQAALAANGASSINPLTDALYIGEGLDGVLDNLEITVDSATGLVLERNIAGSTVTPLGSVDILGPSVVTDCNQSAAASIPRPAAGKLIVTAIPACKTYDAKSFTGGNGVVYIGLLNGDTPAVLGGTLSYGGTSQGARDVGSYTIVPGGLTSDNYIITYAESTLTISPASLPVLVNTPLCNSAAVTTPVTVQMAKASVMRAAATAIDTGSTNASAAPSTLATDASGYLVSVPEGTVATISAPTINYGSTTTSVLELTGATTSPITGNYGSTITSSSGVTLATISPTTINYGTTIASPSISLTTPSAGTMAVTSVCFDNVSKVFQFGVTSAGSGLVGGDSVTIPSVPPASASSVLSGTISFGSGAIASNYSNTNTTNSGSFTITPIQFVSPGVSVAPN